MLILLIMMITIILTIILTIIIIIIIGGLEMIFLGREIHTLHGASWVCRDVSESCLRKPKISRNIYIYIYMYREREREIHKTLPCKDIADVLLQR